MRPSESSGQCNTCRILEWSNANFLCHGLWNHQASRWTYEQLKLADLRKRDSGDAFTTHFSAITGGPWRLHEFIK